MTVRVRIAPSPTGNLHVGTARTALFNYLFALRHQGQFILRIEDTDTERSKPEYEQNIFDSLHALGIHWQEGPDVGGAYGPYRQSQRGALYAEALERLLASGDVYPCYHTPQELEQEREAAKAEGRAYIYSGACRDLQHREALLKADPTRQPSYRFKIPENTGPVCFHDVIRGDMQFDSALLGDFIVAKSDRSPTFNFANVVDDMAMNITHVIRGEDHLSNTPRQVLLYRALGATALPVFAHVGMILAPDRSKLSKRHGATAVSDFAAQGYLPEAVCNFLALLGWSPPDGQEVASLDHFACQFALDRIAQSPAVFDQDKLDWLNGLMIRAMAPEALLEAVLPYWQAAGYAPETKSTDTLQAIVLAVYEGWVRLQDAVDTAQYFFVPPTPQTTDAEAAAVLQAPEAVVVLTAFQQQLLPQLSQAADAAAVSLLLKAWTKAVQAETLYKTKTLLWTLRAALTGRVHGADLSQILWLLGHAEITHRLAMTVKK